MKTKPTSIWQGARTVAIAGCENNFATPPFRAVWADCIRCNQSIIARFDDLDDTPSKAEYSDAEAAKLFKSYGWSIKPVLCPVCIAKRAT